MPIYQTATYRVRPEGVETVKRAIATFVDHVRGHEPGTRFYHAWQAQADPTTFVHLFIFEDAEAQRIHSESAAVARFEAAYTPELVSDGVDFVDFDLVAGNVHP